MKKLTLNDIYNELLKINDKTCVQNCHLWRTNGSEVELNEINEKCCYYSGCFNRKQNIEARDFIQKYFKEGDKDKISLFFTDKQLSPMRYEHMRSVFLLGIAFYDNVQPIRFHVNRLISKIFNKTKESIYNPSDRIPSPYDKKNLSEFEMRQEFLYLWYLICLFHDAGYCYERPKEKMPEDALFIRSQLLTDLQAYYVNDEVLGIPKVLRENAAKYYHLRESCPLFNKHGGQVMDHGICGGIQLINILKDVSKSFFDSEETWESGGLRESDGRGLVWGKPIFDNYIVPAAWTIICHNIWTIEESNQERRKEYEFFGLKNLTYPKGNPIIDIHEHSILWLLCLIDTLDPVKMFLPEDQTIDDTESFNELKKAVIFCFDDNLIKMEIDLCNIKFFGPGAKCRRECEIFRQSQQCVPNGCHKTIEKNLEFLGATSVEISSLETQPHGCVQICFMGDCSFPSNFDFSNA